LKYLFITFLFFSTSFSQQVTQIAVLGTSLNESSGILYLNEKIITHNDSQGEAALFEVDSLTGQASRIVVVANAFNNDWEDLAYDDTYIYIGDFGNNSGDRTDLKIYRISQFDYWNTTNDTVIADTIRFSYSAQTDFTPHLNATNWDCEAMTIIGDSIYLFSKNWNNQKTYVYIFPKSIGNYSLNIRDSLPIQGLITSADFNSISNRLMLVGYTPFAPFVVEIDWNTTVPTSQLSRNRYSISVPGSIQVEAIAAISGNNYYLTSEAFFGNPSNLMRLIGGNGSLLLDEESVERAILFPNPSDGMIHIKCKNFKYFNVFSVDGRQVFQSDKQQVDLSFSDPGTYRICVFLENNSISQFLLVKR
jgi:hypothetical protein